MKNEFVALGRYAAAGTGSAARQRLRPRVAHATVRDESVA
jgi:hypothetical protein